MRLLTAHDSHVTQTLTAMATILYSTFTNSRFVRAFIQRAFGADATSVKFGVWVQEAPP